MLLVFRATKILSPVGDDIVCQQYELITLLMVAFRVTKFFSANGVDIPVDHDYQSYLFFQQLELTFSELLKSCKQLR